MSHRLIPSVFLAAMLAFGGAGLAQDSAPTTAPVAADSGKWDVTAPHGPTRRIAFTTGEGTWMSCDVSPDGTTVVFDLLGELWTLPIAGGRATLLRGGTAWDVQPRYSPDGRSISFTSDAGGGDNVWIMDKDGANARAVTKETFRLLNNAVWTPDGAWLVARKHFTSGRSLGAGEMWMYHRTGGEGVRLTTKRTDQKDVGEPCVSPDGKALFYSEDVTPGDTFEYSKNPHEGIYAIQRLDLTTGKTRTLVSGAGGAVRPQVSPDGKTLAFVRRVRFESVLCLFDLQTETVRQLWSGLSRDQQETWAIFGVHPGFAWTPDGGAVVVQAKGGLWRVDVADGKATPIPFVADVDLEVAETVRSPQRLAEPEFKVRVTRWPDVAAGGGAVVYGALGQTWIKALPDGTPRRLTANPAREYMPSFSPDGRSVVQVTWSDDLGGAVEVVDVASGTARRLTSVAGSHAEPRFSADGKQVVWRVTGGDGIRGTVRGLRAGIWIVDAAGGEPRFVTDSGTLPRFTPAGDRLWLHRGGPKLVTVDLNGQDERVVASSQHASEFLVSPDGRHVAFTELFQAWIAALPPSGREVVLSPDGKAVPVRKLSRDAGEYLSFSPDSSRVRYALASRLTEAVVADVFAGKPEDAGKPVAVAAEHDLSFLAKTDVPDTDVVFEHLTLVTMRGDEILADARLHVRGDRIVAVGAAVGVPPAAKVIDGAGMVVVPGFIDVHAHMGRGSLGIIPQQSWPLLANLAFGVTTIHDPSADTKTVFSESEMSRAGVLLAPRVLSTGTILYGAEGDFKAVINSHADAMSHLRRMQAFGAFTVKSYNQPRRDQRQQVIAAARELGMMVVPEGGSTFFHNLNQIVDGHTTIEHALPVAPIHADVVNLFARSGTAYTPTLIVGYGGWWGENWFYQHDEVWKNERLLRFVPRGVIDSRAIRREMVPEEDLNHVELARGAAAVVRAGGLAQIGAHGQIQGLGAHWEMRMFAQGGLTNHEVLRVATLMGAKALGLDGDIGSIEAGKLADLVFYDKERQPLADLRQSEHVKWVMKGGRLFDAATLDQILPVAVKLPAGPRLEMLGAEPSDAPTCPCHVH